LIESGNWKLDATALEAIDRSTALAVLPNASDSLSGINYDHMAYLNILSLPSGGVADAAGTMPCLKVLKLLRLQWLSTFRICYRTIASHFVTLTTYG